MIAEADCCSQNENAGTIERSVECLQLVKDPLERRA